MSSHHIQIGDISPRIQYTGDGAQVAFTYPFPIFKDADIEVFEDTTQQTIVTDYTVSGAGNDSGGTVTFVTAPLTSVVVTLKRNITIARTSDFDESGAFRSKVINDELDTITAVQQQIQDSIDRSLRLSDTDTAGTLTLPVLASRKGKFLHFDDTTGDPEASEVAGVAVLSDTDAQDIGAAAPGTSGEVSREDHVHALPDDAVTTAKINDNAVTLAKQAAGTAGRLLGYDTNGDPAVVRGIITNNGYKTSDYYSAGGEIARTNTLVVTADRMYFRPFLVYERTTFTRLGIEVTASAGTSGRLGLYQWANGIPGALIVDGGTFSTGSNAVVEVTISQTLMPGMYAAAAIFDDTPTVSAAQMDTVIRGLMGAVSPWSDEISGAGYRTFTFAALPDPFGSVTARLDDFDAGAVPSLSLRVV